MGILNLGKVAFRAAQKFVNNNYETIGIATAATLGIGGMFMLEYFSRPDTLAMKDEFTLTTKNNDSKNVNNEECEILGDRKLITLPEYNKPQEERVSPKDKCIGGVEFQEGLVKDVQITNAGAQFNIDFSPNADKTYTVTLIDGSSFDYAPQVGTNKAQVYMENGVLVLKGIRRMYFHNQHYSEKDSKQVYSNIGNYKFVGCQGAVNTEDVPGEKITTAHRVMPDGTKQESCIGIIWEQRNTNGSYKVVGDKLTDHYILTDNDCLM